jgi:methanogenic corrinoid protein MtbC1
MESNHASKDHKRHPIQVVAARSGLSPDLLRAWERRYDAVHPERSDGGQRLYSDEDVERLRLLRMATEAGRRISEVAKLGEEELSILVLEDELESTRTTEDPPVSDPMALVDAMDAIEALDGARLEEVLTQQLMVHGTTDLIEGLVAPLMYEVGRRWHEGELGIHHEHLSTAVLRGTVSRILADSQPQHPLGVLLLGTTQGQRHEVGLLMVAAMAAQLGWRVVYLGSDLPASEIADASIRVGADVVGLSLMVLNEQLDDLEEIRSVADGILPGVGLMVGGPAAQSLRAEILSLGAQVIADLAGFREFLAHAGDRNAG